MSLRRFAFWAMVVPLLSCEAAGILGVLPESRTPEGIRYETHDTLFRRGDTVSLVLTNSTDRQIGHNLCLSVLQVWDGSAWKGVRQAPKDQVCASILRILPPGGSDQYRQPVYSFIRAGAYRFRDEIVWLDSGERVEVLSNGFRVR